MRPRTKPKLQRRVMENPVHATFRETTPPAEWQMRQGRLFRSYFDPNPKNSVVKTVAANMHHRLPFFLVAGIHDFGDEDLVVSRIVLMPQFAFEKT